VGSEQGARIVDHQSQAPSALLFTPPNPCVAGVQPARGRTKNQNPQPLAFLVKDSIPDLLPDGFDVFEIVLGFKELLGFSLFILPFHRANDDGF